MKDEVQEVAIWEWEPQFASFLERRRDEGTDDGAHDLEHVRRVVDNARRFGRGEGAPPAVVIPAAWLHDCVTVPKDSPERPRASRLAAETAVSFLQEIDYPAQYLDEIGHAIAAHSFSAGIPPRTAAAKVVQDADRIDALGAVGIARCFMVGGKLERPLYHPTDPFCREREPDDRLATLDHFYTKLLRLPATMQTAAGRREAQARVAFMRRFLDQLAGEIPKDNKTQ